MARPKNGTRDAKLAKASLDVLEIAIGVEMVAIDRGHHRHHRLQAQEAAVELVGFATR